MDDCVGCGLPHDRCICDDDGFEDDYDDRYDGERACVDCGAPGIDLCCCCGGYLCGMHGEIGAGFCKSCPSQGWIDEQQEPSL